MHKMSCAILIKLETSCLRVMLKNLVHQVAVKTEAEWEARNSVFEFSPVEPVPLWVQETDTISSFKMRLDKAHRWAWIR